MIDIETVCRRTLSGLLVEPADNANAPDQRTWRCKWRHGSTGPPLPSERMREACIRLRRRYMYICIYIYAYVYIYTYIYTLSFALEPTVLDAKRPAALCIYNIRAMKTKRPASPPVRDEPDKLAGILLQQTSGRRAGGNELRAALNCRRSSTSHMLPLLRARSSGISGTSHAFTRLRCTPPS